MSEWRIGVSHQIEFSAGNFLFYRDPCNGRWKMLDGRNEENMYSVTVESMLSKKTEEHTIANIKKQIRLNSTDDMSDKEIYMILGAIHAINNLAPDPVKYQSQLHRDEEDL